MFRHFKVAAGSAVVAAAYFAAAGSAAADTVIMDQITPAGVTAQLDVGPVRTATLIDQAASGGQVASEAVQLIQAGRLGAGLAATGAFNEISLMQAGSDNASLAWQWGGASAGNLITVSQTGVNDMSVVLQHDTLGAQALVEQTGAGDQSVIVQEGSLGASGLYAEVHQSAPDAQNYILQSGTMNVAMVYQTAAASSYSSIAQSGFGNTAIVRQ